MSKGCKHSYKPDRSLFVSVGANKMEGGTNKRTLQYCYKWQLLTIIHISPRSAYAIPLMKYNIVGYLERYQKGGLGCSTCNGKESAYVFIINV